MAGFCYSKIKHSEKEEVMTDKVFWAVMQTRNRYKQMESSHRWSIQHNSDVKRDLQKEIDGLYSLQYLFGEKKKKSHNKGLLY